MTPLAKRITSTPTSAGKFRAFRRRAGEQLLEPSVQAFVSAKQRFAVQAREHGPCDVLPVDHEWAPQARIEEQAEQIGGRWQRLRFGGKSVKAGSSPTRCYTRRLAPRCFTARDLSLDVCRSGGRMTSTITSCGGTIVTMVTREGAGRYFCFDPRENLIGQGTQSEDGKRTLERGVDCEARGTTLNLCD